MPAVIPRGHSVTGTLRPNRQPLYLSVGVVLEEGLPIEHLRRVVTFMQQAAGAAGGRLVTGDTKVVEHGEGDGLYVNTAGIGLVRAGVAPAPRNCVQVMSCC